MYLLNYLRMVMRRPSRPPKRDHRSALEIDQETVSRFTKGNVPLQFGQYLTKEDLDNEWKQIEGLRAHGR